RQIQIGRGADKAAGFHDFQECARDVNIHTATTFISIENYIHLLALVSQADSWTHPNAMGCPYPMARHDPDISERSSLPWRSVIYWIAASAVTAISVRALVRLCVATGAIRASDATLATLVALPVAFLVLVLFSPRSARPHP